MTMIIIYERLQWVMVFVMLSKKGPFSVVQLLLWSGVYHRFNENICAEPK